MKVLFETDVRNYYELQKKKEEASKPNEVVCPVCYMSFEVMYGNCPCCDLHVSILKSTISGKKQIRLVYLHFK
jgi:predicted amidophosphoribosyltransferase